MEQQAQTLAYFDSVAEEWRRKAEGAVPAVNIIAQRNNCAIRVAQRMSPRPRKFLDLGCGTGELALAMAQMGIGSEGIDFAPEMIALCKEKGTKLAVPNATFRVESVLQMTGAEGSYDLIGAMGLIEYLTLDQMQQMFREASRLLLPGGALVVGSRNRLFNVFSLSDYTRLEQELGVVDALLSESLAIASAVDMPSALAAARSSVRDLLPQPKEHPRTGIGVNVRYQYTPGELLAQLSLAGLDGVTLFPVHYHAMPVPAAKAAPAVHVRLSTGLNEAAPQDHRLVPFSSSFVVEARKR